MKFTNCLQYPPFRSLLEKKIYKIICKDISHDYIEINKKGLIRNNKRLEIDLYIPSINIGIEIQGPSHTSNEHCILHDFEKKKIFLKNNIQLIYIYTDSYSNQKYSIQKCIEIVKTKIKENEKLVVS